MRRIIEEVIEDYPVERSRSQLAEESAASIARPQLSAPVSRFASQSVNSASAATPDVVKDNPSIDVKSLAEVWTSMLQITQGRQQAINL